MAQWDDSEDSYDRSYSSTDQPTTSPDSISRAQLVAQLYQTALGRPAAQAEIDQWANGPLTVAQIQQGIYNSDEAKAYSTKQSTSSTVTPTNTTPDPTTTGPTTPVTPATNTGPAPAAGTSSPGQAVSYTPPPAYVPPPAFHYDDFQPVSADEVYQTPQYQFDLSQGMQAIGAKNAALGTLNTGGTLKDFVGFGANLANSYWNNINSNKLQTYTTNRGNALDTYNTNYGTQYKDPYMINYQSQYADPFANDMAVAGLDQNNSQFNASLGQNNNQFNTSLDFNKWLQNYKMNVTDPFQQKYSLLGLL